MASTGGYNTRLFTRIPALCQQSFIQTFTQNCGFLPEPRKDITHTAPSPEVFFGQTGSFFECLALKDSARDGDGLLLRGPFPIQQAFAALQRLGPPLPLVPPVRMDPNARTRKRGRWIAPIQGT